MLKKLSVCLLINLTAGLAHAQVYNSSASAGAGGSGRASVEPGDVIYLNPATLPHLAGDHFLGSFGKDEMALSLSDNNPENSFPGAISYIQKRMQLPDLFVPGTTSNTKLQNFTVTVANFVADHWSVGVNAHYFESVMENADTTSYRQINGDIGIAYVPNQTLGFGLVAYNIAGERKDVPEVLRLSPTLGFGMNYIYHTFVRYRFDVVTAPEYNFGKPTLETGFETFLTKFMVWWIGAQDNLLVQNTFWTTGIGFSGPKFAINYAYQGNTKESADYRHSIDLQVPF